MQFTTGKIDGVIVSQLARNVDGRGSLMETFRSDSLPRGVSPAMSYISVTEPGIARGPHEHHRQTDILVFPGPGTFRIVLWDKREKSPTLNSRMILVGGTDAPIAVIVPPGVVHAYRNMSQTERGTVLNFPDALYAGWGRKEPVDEVRHEVEGDPFFADFLHA